MALRTGLTTGVPFTKVYMCFPGFSKRRAALFLAYRIPLCNNVLGHFALARHRSNAHRLCYFMYLSERC
jgi:hypothetical protein